MQHTLGSYGTPTFSDPDRLLAECATLGLEGIVSKRKDAPYRSGKGDWVKVKTRAWCEANRDRGELFNPLLRSTR